MGSNVLLSGESYKRYLKTASHIRDERIRPDGESLFSVLLSEEADFTQSPEGVDIIKAIRDFK